MSCFLLHSLHNTTSRPPYAQRQSLAVEFECLGIEVYRNKAGWLATRGSSALQERSAAEVRQTSNRYLELEFNFMRSGHEGTQQLMDRLHDTSLMPWINSQ